ncbi:predicted protein [Naegleria gruberi]|uniref:Predicted protein n=1 Tax=Naegleria gruberi TaxID=5762 RepID=D2VUW8_NAEGR|nr:uncharacterized protein NAEGRDRAFT_72812 [Naegleria gruberi]EFC39338.1 predicted protein [Naegleria gruberi]|eukprot:XP_002672082.1 predicted protein [Naegleria gruberi strain NEG-M]
MSKSDFFLFAAIFVVISGIAQAKYLQIYHYNSRNCLESNYVKVDIFREGCFSFENYVESQYATCNGSYGYLEIMKNHIECGKDPIVFKLGVCVNIEDDIVRSYRVTCGDFVSKEKMFWEMAYNDRRCEKFVRSATGHVIGKCDATADFGVGAKVYTCERDDTRVQVLTYKSSTQCIGGIRTNQTWTTECDNRFQNVCGLV